jgi:hypothetical protein
MQPTHEEHTMNVNENGIAWMIAGGVRADSAEDRRQRLHRTEIAHSAVSRGDVLLRLRGRVAAMIDPRIDPRPTVVSADCCPA